MDSLGVADTSSHDAEVEIGSTSARAHMQVCVQTQTFVTKTKRFVPSTPYIESSDAPALVFADDEFNMQRSCCFQNPRPCSTKPGSLQYETGVLAVYIAQNVAHSHVR